MSRSTNRERGANPGCARCTHPVYEVAETKQDNDQSGVTLISRQG